MPPAAPPQCHKALILAENVLYVGCIMKNAPDIALHHNPGASFHREFFEETFKRGV
jgi:hypothetical protein